MNRPPANPKEMAEMMRKMQQEMDKLSPAQKKMMQDMGIGAPAMPAMPTVSNSQYAQAAGLQTVPPRDAARIAQIPASPLTPSALNAFVNNAQTIVTGKLNAHAKSLGDRILVQLKSEGKSNLGMGNAAVGLWMMGRAQTALQVMGSVYKVEPNNADNISNYAAMLSMSGGEQWAVPMLEHLNTRFPNNSTVLNNLGQAWFGLGVIDKAARYLQDAVRLSPYHPQANYSLSFIEESRGNKAAAVEAAKRAIKAGYTRDKHNRLRKLGYKLQGDDLDFPFKPDPDPLGLNNFKLPPMPFSVDDNVQYGPAWDDFRNQTDARMEDLARKRKVLMTPKIQAATEFGKKVVGNLGNAVAPPLGESRGRNHLVELKLKAMDAPGNTNERYRRSRKALDDFAGSYQALSAAYDKEIEVLREESRAIEARAKVEGGVATDFCEKAKAVTTRYISEWNRKLDTLGADFQKQTRLKLSEELFWKQFSKSAEDFELEKVNAQSEWLAALKVSGVQFDSDRKSISYCLTKQGKPQRYGKLADFNDVHCEYHSKLDLGLGSIESHCNKMETKLGVGFLKLGLKQDMDKDGFADQFISCSAQVTVGLKDEKNKVDLGPVSVEVSAEAGIGIEIDRSGISDLYVTVEGKAEVGTNAIEKTGEQSEMGGLGVKDATIGAGVIGRISLISGKTSIEGSGILNSK